MAVSMSAGMISMRSGYLATKLMAMADAFRSQSAWSCRKAGKSDKTVRTHSGRVEAARSSEYFMRSQVMLQFGGRGVRVFRGRQPRLFSYTRRRSPGRLAFAHT